MSDPSVDELRHESERSRAALTNTVGELTEKVHDTANDLKTRLSAAHLKDEVKDYVREGADDLVHTIEKRVRANPIQAVAVGAALAYPLWGVLKTIPVPILLLGAGALLSRQKRWGGPDIPAAVSQAGVTTADYLANSVHDAKTAIASNAEAVADKVRTTAHDVSGAVEDIGHRLVGAVKDKSTDAAETVTTNAIELRHKAAEVATQSQNAIEDLVNRNPLLAASVCVGIGAFIAASLPPSDVENRIFGESSDDVKSTALGAASRGVERAKNVADGMVSDIAAASTRGGLTAEELTQALGGLTTKVKIVADKGLKAALGEEEPSPSNRSEEECPPSPPG
jgi:ElaB/YqjD/DUF883 family membrane-anchored ribosome-binding protein